MRRLLSYTFLAALCEINRCGSEKRANKLNISIPRTIRCSTSAAAAALCNVILPPTECNSFIILFIVLAVCIFDVFIDSILLVTPLNLVFYLRFGHSISLARPFLCSPVIKCISVEFCVAAAVVYMHAYEHKRLTIF